MPRRRLAIFAYAIHPLLGSEPGVGWAWAAAADPERFDITVVTGRNAFDAMTDQEREKLPGDRLVVLESRLDGFHVDGRVRHLRYVAWLRACRRWSRRQGFGPDDVVHHLTYGSDSLPPAFALDIPARKIWGPIGGATYPPLKLVATRSPRWMAGELARWSLTSINRRLGGFRAAGQVDTLIAMNGDVASVYRDRTPFVVTTPSGAFAAEDLIVTERRSRVGPPLAVYGGRLLSYKGLDIALRALRQPAAAEWRFAIYGEGPEEARLRRLADRLGIADRVEFWGRVPRAELLGVLRSADALLFPSLHDSCAWVVAEAAVAGLPVVCLDLGGPPEIAGPRAVAVDPGGSAGAVSRRIAVALHELAAGGPGAGAVDADMDRQWGQSLSAARLPGLLEALYG